MSETPINLNRFKKQKARAEKRARGDANAARHGMSKSERAARNQAAARAARHLDDHALQKPQSHSDRDPEPS